MAHDDERLVWMRGCELEHRRDHPLAHLVVALAVLPALAALLPAAEAVGIVGLDLAMGEPGPAADVDLAQPRVDPHLEPELAATISAVSRARSRSLE